MYFLFSWLRIWYLVAYGDMHCYRGFTESCLRLISVFNYVGSDLQG